MLHLHLLPHPLSDCVPLEQVSVVVALGAYDVAAVDKQGRITLDEQCRRHAGLTAGGQAVVAGAIRMLEVWRPSRYHTIRNEDGIVQPGRVWLDEGDET